MIFPPIPNVHCPPSKSLQDIDTDMFGALALRRLAAEGFASRRAWASLTELDETFWLHGGDASSLSCVTLGAEMDEYSRIRLLPAMRSGESALEGGLHDSRAVTHRLKLRHRLAAFRTVEKSSTSAVSAF